MGVREALEPAYRSREEESCLFSWAAMAAVERDRMARVLNCILAECGLKVTDISGRRIDLVEQQQNASVATVVKVTRRKETNESAARNTSPSLTSPRVRPAFRPQSIKVSAR